MISISVVSSSLFQTIIFRSQVNGSMKYTASSKASASSSSSGVIGTGGSSAMSGGMATLAAAYKPMKEETQSLLSRGRCVCV